MAEDEGNEVKVEVVEKQKGGKKKREKQSKQEIGNQILNEMYENQEQIDPS